MSASLVRKSLEICDSSSAGSRSKKRNSSLRKLRKLEKQKHSHLKARSVAEVVQRMHLEADRTLENIRQLELLSSREVDEETAKKIINRVVKTNEVEVKKEEPQGTVFTEEDFEKFEKEYFVDA